LIATNEVSSLLITFRFLIEIPLGLISFNSSLYDRASVLGEYSVFLFRITSGENFTCNVKFGDGFSLNDSFWNEKSISHLYPSIVKFYEIQVFCQNSLNNATYSVLHYVEKKLYNLYFLNNTVEPNMQINLMFSLKGSNPMFNLHIKSTFKFIFIFFKFSLI
jgi:hypothetical protein